MKMGKRIHTRVFCMVLLVILLMTLLAGYMFSVTSDWYIDQMTERSVMEITDMVTEMQKTVSVPEDKTKDLETQYSKELLQEVKKTLKKGGNTGELLVYNSRFKQVYPNTAKELSIPLELSFEIAKLLENGSLEPEKSRKLELAGEEWYIRLCKVDTTYRVRAQYFVAVAQIPDVSVLWRYTGKLLFVIAVFTIGIAAVLIWFAAGSISRPLKQLCQKAREIGNENYRSIDQTYSLEELELLKEAFNQMGDQLKENEEQKKIFFQNISHDLRTPLASITGYAQGIQCDVMKDSKKAAEVILSESLRMTNMVESILTLTKMDQKELRLHMVELELEEFLEDRLEVLQGITGHCRIELEECEAPVCIQTDPELLGRIIQNIVANCIRYAENSIILRVAREGKEAVIHIEDDGPGFAPEDIPHVFERFYQGTSGKFGIGLSVVWSGMEYLGGTVEISNRVSPEHGAIYQLHLP